MLHDFIVGVVPGVPGSTELSRILSQYPSLVKNSCHIDIYRPWSHESYYTVAEQWLQNHADRVNITLFSNIFYRFII